MDTNRRAFLHRCGALVGALAAWLSGGSAWSARVVAVGLDKVPALRRPGGAAVLKVEGQELLVVRETATTVRAVSARCTHAGCALGFDAASGQVACSCHGARFALDGRVLRAPATKPLSTVPARLEPTRIVLEI